MPAFVDTGLNLAHVDDVAAGHLAALRKGRTGERYILGGENVLLSQMLADIAGMVGRKAPTVKLPRAAVYPIAFVSEQIARITGKAPFATIDGIRMSRPGTCSPRSGASPASATSSAARTSAGWT